MSKRPPPEHEDDPLAMLPWYCRDWFASDAYDTMNLEQQGAYRNLIDRAFQRPGCLLPADPARLQQLSGATPEEWVRVRDVVLKWLPERAGNRVNHRALREWKKSRKLRRTARKRAKEAAKKRWEKEMERRKADAPSIARALLEECPPNANSQLPTPTPTPNSQRTTTEREAAASVVAGNGHGTPPAAASPPALPHDPADLVQSQLVKRCRELAEKAAAAEGRTPSDADVREVLRAVSTTPSGKYLTDLRGASPSWVAESLRACEGFEDDLA